MKTGKGKQTRKGVEIRNGGRKGKGREGGRGGKEKNGKGKGGQNGREGEGRGEEGMGGELGRGQGEGEGKGGENGKENSITDSREVSEMAKNKLRRNGKREGEKWKKERGLPNKKVGAA